MMNAEVKTIQRSAFSIQRLALSASFAVLCAEIWMRAPWRSKPGDAAELRASAAASAAFWIV